MRFKRSLALLLSIVMVFGVFIPVAFAEEEDAINRIAGKNRWETAVAVSQEGWEKGSDVVVLASGEDFADALAGVPLAHKLGAPLLLTRAAGLPAVIKAEITRLEATKVIVLGGTTAVSEEVVAELEAMELEVERIAGANRFETAALIAAHEVFEGIDTVFIATGAEFADALAAASYAAQLGFPILLTHQNRVPTATEGFLEGIENIYVIGGPSVIADGLYEGAERIAGLNRYLTALALAKKFAPEVTMFFIATGIDYPDALAGAVLAAQQGTGILLVGNSLNADVAEFLKTNVKEVTAFGGTAVVPPAVGNDIVEAITPPEEAYLAELQAMTTTISATHNDKGEEIRAGGTEIYFYGLDQYGKDFTIADVSGIDVEFTINDMPLSIALTDFTFVVEGGLAKISTSQNLYEGDILNISFASDDFEANFTFTVTAAAAGLVSKVEITADETAIAALEEVTFGVKAWNQWNNPENVDLDDFRWVIRQDGEIVYNGTGLKDDSDASLNPYPFNEAGTYTVQVFLIKNTSVRNTITIEVSPAALKTLGFTSEGEDHYNKEDCIIGVLEQNEGAVLNPADVKFHVTVPASAEYAASDIEVWAQVRGGTKADKNDIVVVVNSAEAGFYTITAYVGLAHDDDDAVATDSFDVTTEINPEVASMVIEGFKTNEMAIGAEVEKAISFFNKHGEEVQVLPGDLTITPTAGITATAAADEDGFLFITFEATTKGTKTVTFVTGDVSKAIEVIVVDAAKVTTVTLQKTVTVIAGDAYKYNAKGDRTDIYHDGTNAYVAMPLVVKNQYGFVMDVKSGDIVLPSEGADLICLAKDAEGEYIAAGDAAVAAIGVYVAAKPEAALTYTIGVKVDEEVENNILNKVAVTVKDARVATTFEIDDFDLSIMTGAPAAQIIKWEDIVVKDQYGVKMTVSDVTFNAVAKGTVVTVVNDETQVTLTGAEAGTDTITFKMLDAEGTLIKSLVYKMTVSTEAQITRIEIEPIGTLNTQADVSLYGENRYDQATAKVKVFAGDIEVAYDNSWFRGWYTNDATVADVDGNGLIQAAYVGDTEGIATITVETANGTSASVQVTVVNTAPIPTTVKLVDRKDLPIPTETDGDTIDLMPHVAIYDENGVEMLAGGFNVAYRSLNTVVLTVTEAGVVKGEQVGKATIRVTVTVSSNLIGIADVEITVKAIAD